MVGVRLVPPVGGCVDDAWQDRVRAHALLAVLRVERLDERDHGRLGGDVAGRPAEWPQRGTRRHGHERPAAALDEPRHCGVRQVEGRRDVEAEHAVEVLPARLVDERPVREATHQVDDGLEIVHGRDRGIRAARRIQQVRADELDPVAELLARPLELLLDDPGDRAVVARVEQLAHDPAAQRTGAAGDQHTHGTGG
jgi:hypothetical protein